MVVPAEEERTDGDAAFGIWGREESRVWAKLNLDASWPDGGGV